MSAKSGSQTMKVKTSNAPVSWGMSYVGQPGSPPWQKVLREIAEAGYRFTELGPIGFYPEDPKRFGEALAENGLTLVAGHISSICTIRVGATIASMWPAAR